ncbi:dol-P-Man:Man(7)GlcNAc(2)-PP-Dol alpha-1,6-mannosyltransferase [Trifolium repens]|nr:dol-P-Man:Man(7)GlcNAc(2)-PP-Dol alpha-1,6-mannosyltransferase [Trifolium repens]
MSALQFGFLVDRRVRSFAIPALAFIFHYFKLPHKELRFILSSVPIFNLSASTAFTNNSIWNLLFLIMLRSLLMCLGVTITTFTASYWNYPSGHALKKLHGTIEETYGKPKIYSHLVYEWMNNRPERIRISASDAAIQLDLIAKVHGVSSAEGYFLNLTNNLKDKRTY